MFCASAFKMTTLSLWVNDSLLVRTSKVPECFLRHGFVRIISWFFGLTRDRSRSTKFFNLYGYKILGDKQWMTRLAIEAFCHTCFLKDCSQKPSSMKITVEPGSNRILACSRFTNHFRTKCTIFWESRLVPEWFWRFRSVNKKVIGISESVYWYDLMFIKATWWGLRFRK